MGTFFFYLVATHRRVGAHASYYDKAALESNGRIGKSSGEALKLASTSLERMLGVNISPNQRSYVAWKGGDALGMTSKAVAVFSAARGLQLL